MTKKLGNDYRLWVESAVAGTFNEVAGGQDLGINRSGSTIDTTTKDDFPYGTQAGGTRQLSIPFSLIPDLPDADGYTRLKTVALAVIATPFNVQIRKGGSAGADPADVVFEGPVYCTDLNESFGQNDAVKASGTLVLAAAPVTDTLA